MTTLPLACVSFYFKAWTTSRVRPRNVLPVIAALFLFAGPHPHADAQSVHTWNGGTDLDWNNPANWAGGVPDGNDLVNIAGAAGGSLTGVYSTALNQYRLLFNGGAGSYTLNGPSAVTFFDFGGNAPIIENNAAGTTQTINFATILNGTAGGGFGEINPVDGNLRFNSTVDLAGTTQLRVFGNNGNTVTFDGAISGGANSFALNQNSNAVFRGVNTYTGDSFINAGNLRIEAGSQASGTFRIGDTAGTANSQMTLAGLGAGVLVNRPVEARAGSTGTRTLAGAAGASSNTLSGTIALNAPLTVDSPAGSHLRLTGIISGAQPMTLTGSGRTSLTAANTYTGPTTIPAGHTVVLGNVTGLGAGGVGNETIVQSGGTIDVGGTGVVPNNERYQIIGTGVGGIGALINQGQANAANGGTGFVSLTGDATINAGGTNAAAFRTSGEATGGTGIGRLDTRVGAYTAGTENLDLNGFTLTKTGGALHILVNAEVTTGNIVVNQGIFGVEADTRMLGAGNIRVNEGGRLTFWSLANNGTGINNGGTSNWNITLNGGVVGDLLSTGAAQTMPAPIEIIGASNPTFTSIGGNVTTLSGVISRNPASTTTAFNKRGGGALALSNIANSFDLPVNIFQGTLLANHQTALPAGGVSPAAPLTSTDTPLGLNSTVTIAGGNLGLRINMANDNTQQRWLWNRNLVLDLAPANMTFDRLSNASQVDKHVIVPSLTFAAPTAANGYTIGQNQLTFSQGNTHRLELPSVTMNNDTRFELGDFTFSGDILSPGGHTLQSGGGNTRQFIGAGTHQFNAVFHTGGSLRVGSGFGTPTTSDTVTVGTGQLYFANGTTDSFRNPGNFAPGQIAEFQSQRVSIPTLGLGTAFSSVPANVRATGAGVISGSGTWAAADLSEIGDGTWRLGSNLHGAGNLTVTGPVAPGAGNLTRIGGTGTVTYSGVNAFTGTTTVEVGAPLTLNAFASNSQGTAVINAAKDYSGGTMVNRGSTLSVQTVNALGTGPVNVFGTLSFNQAGGTLVSGGANTNVVNLYGGSSLVLDSGAVSAVAGLNTANRYADTAPMVLNGGNLTVSGHNATSAATLFDSVETIGALTVNGGATMNLNRNGGGNLAVGQNLVVNTASITRGIGASLELIRNTGTGAGYAGGHKLINSAIDAAPTNINGIVSSNGTTPDVWLVGQNNGPGDYFSYVTGNGYTVSTYDATYTTGTYTAGANNTVGSGAGITGGRIDVTTAALTLTDNPTWYLLRSNQNISLSGANNTINLRAGAFNANNSTGTITVTPAMVFQDPSGATGEGVIYTRSGGTASLTGTVTASGLTKFGPGTLVLNAASPSLTGPVSVNQGVLQLHGPTATGTHNVAGNGMITLQGGTLNLRSHNSAVTGTINPTFQNGLTVAAGIPLATVDMNRSGADTASSGTFIFNPAAAGPGLVLGGSPGSQGQTLSVTGANYSMQFGSNAQNSIAGNVNFHIANGGNLQLNNAPTITGTNPVISKSGGNTLIVGSVAGSPSVAPGTRVVVNDGTLELRSLTAVGTGLTTSIELNRGTLNLRRDTSGVYGGTAANPYPVSVNGNTTISADRTGGTANPVIGIGRITVNGLNTLTTTNGNGATLDIPGMNLNGNGLLNIGSNSIANQDSGTRVFGTVTGGSLIKSGAGWMHLTGANNTYSGGTIVNAGILRLRAANAAGTGRVLVNPGAILDLNAADNLGASQPLVVRSSTAFPAMISMNTDVPHPTGANVTTTGNGIIGLSNGSAGVYNTDIDMGALYGGRWSLGGIQQGAYDPRYTADTLGVGADNLYRLGGGGTSFFFGVDSAGAPRNNVLTGPANSVRLGYDSGNILTTAASNATGNFQFVLGGTNNYGGPTVIHRGMAARAGSAAAGGNSVFGSGAVDVFGVLMLSSNATLQEGGTATNALSLHPGSHLILDNNGAPHGTMVAANVADRIADGSPVALRSSVINLIGRDAVASTETIGDVTYSGGARLRAGRTGTGSATLTLNSLTQAAGAGHTLLLATSAAGTLGGVDQIRVTNSPPVPVNGMLSPRIMNLTDNTFVTYGANGFANVTYDTTIAGGAQDLPTGMAPTTKLDINTTATVTLRDDAVVAAVRTNRDINIGSGGNTLTIRSGGFIAQTNNLTVQPNLVFNDGTQNVPAYFYNTNNLDIRGTITADGVIKNGQGDMILHAPNPNYASGWTVNSGHLIVGEANALGQSVPGNGVTLNATHTTGGINGFTANTSRISFQRDDASSETVEFSGGPITVVNEGIVRVQAGDNRNLRVPAVIATSTSPQSSVGLTFDVPNNRFRGIYQGLTLNSDTTLRVFDAGSVGDYGRITAAVVEALNGVNRNLLKTGNRTLELGSDNSATFTGGSITATSGTLRVLHNGALGSATTAVTIERNAALEIGASNFVSTAPITQQPGSVERWNVADARGTGNYNLPAGVNLQLNTNLTGTRTIGLNGGTIEGFLYADHVVQSVQRDIGPNVTINLLADSYIGQGNHLHGQNYDTGRLPTVGQPFGDTYTGAFLVVDGPITGAFDLTKTGLDTVALGSTANSYNNTIVDMGTLRLNVDNSLPQAGTLSPRNGGIFDLYGFNQTVGGLGYLTAGPNPGGTSVGAAGRITNSGITDKTLTVVTTSNYTYNGTIELNTALTKGGSGTLTLGGENTYRGNTTITAGTLALTGSINNTPVIDVQSGATFDVTGAAGGFTLGAAQTLEGSGIILGATTITGTLAPGDSPGTLATGDLVTTAGSTSIFEIGGLYTNSGTLNDHDRVSVTGSLSLAGNLIISLINSYLPAEGTRYFIFTNNGIDAIGGPLFTGLPELGTFGVPETADPNDYWQISYQDDEANPGGAGNDVSVQFVPEPGSAALAALAAALTLSRRRRKS